MPGENATVAVFDSANSVEAALVQLRRAGFDAGRISVAGRDAEEAGGCYHAAGTNLRCFGGSAGFWNELWEALPGWALLSLPGAGRVRIAGALAGWVVTALENAAIFSGLTAFGAALYSLGISLDAVAEFETALAEGKFLVLAHGSAGEVARAKRVLRINELGVERKLSA